ncbi:hypothetical protein KIM372_00410 [Bombiscardovia nodaiensis]|uniref:Gram-positive cocci surface proteins LPxTG domain-containing protein n=1 Tax=Bombiscardovia nodaiensis TaxID=2932181 RepID=A0ABM8B5L5_9BIFI|nr:hypothetical protein KIM372_00410 [Bombiscardovia nodaiensis]
MKRGSVKHWLAGVVSLAAVGTLVAGVAGVANAEETPAPSRPGEAVSISNIRVSEIGAHTANLTFDYKINDTRRPIKRIVPSLFFEKITSIKPKIQFTQDTGVEMRVWLGASGFDSSIGVADSKLTQEDYSKIYGMHTQDDEDAVANRQQFARWGTAVDVTADNKSGTSSLSIIGLDPSTSYATRGYNNILGRDYTRDADAYMSKISELGWDHLNQEVPVDMSRVLVGLNVEYGGSQPGDPVGGDYDTFLEAAPAFSTISEPQSIAEGQLTNQGKDNITPGQIDQNHSARFYINSLKEACKAKVDAGEDCFWYSYIYSDPSKMTAPNGAPYVQVKKDDQNRYYYDAFIPKDFTGEHTVVALDEEGTVQAWTKVSLADNAITQVATPPLPEPAAPQQPAAADPVKPAAPTAADNKVNDPAAKAPAQPAPAAKKVDPAADPAKAELAKTGADVSAVSGIALALIAAAAGCLVVTKRSRV